MFLNISSIAASDILQRRAVSIVCSSSSMLRCLRKEGCVDKKESFFLKNGAAMLEQIVASFNGKCNPLRTYSAEELRTATNDFHRDRQLHQDWSYTLYKGVHKGREVSVKRFKPYGSVETSRYTNEEFLGLIANEAATASQMSNHKCVLKLLGYCLETEVPLLVYEYPANGNLYDHYSGALAVPWETKLRIANGVANAVAYLHHGFSDTILHRDIKSGNIFLDQDYVPKLFEFQNSIRIPEGKAHVDGDLFGTRGFIAPEVLVKSRFTERSDVYGFGVLLCEVLTAMKRRDLLADSDLYQEAESSSSSISKSEFEATSVFQGAHTAGLCRKYLEANVLHAGNEAQGVECCELVKRCLSLNPDDRPNMIHVAQSLRRIRNLKQ